MIAPSALQANASSGENARRPPSAKASGRYMRLRLLPLRLRVTPLEPKRGRRTVPEAVCLKAWPHCTSPPSPSLRNLDGSAARGLLASSQPRRISPTAPQGAPTERAPDSSNTSYKLPPKPPRKPPRPPQRIPKALIRLQDLLGPAKTLNTTLRVAFALARPRTVQAALRMDAPIETSARKLALFENGGSECALGFLRLGLNIDNPRKPNSPARFQRRHS